jgi:hypothetical protein
MEGGLLFIWNRGVLNDWIGTGHFFVSMKRVTWLSLEAFWKADQEGFAL